MRTGDSKHNIVRLRPGNNARFTNNYNLKFGSQNAYEEGDHFGFLGTSWWRMTKISEKYGASGSPTMSDSGRMPTWNEIINGIIEENKKHIDAKYKEEKTEEATQEQIEQEKKNLEVAWRAFGLAADLGDPNRPLDHKELLYKNNKHHQTIMMIYSLETFLYRDLNRASRNRDQSKVRTLGPYACALQCILIGIRQDTFNMYNNQERDIAFQDRVQGFIVYRGISLEPQTIEEEFVTKSPARGCFSRLRQVFGCYSYSKINLGGFISTTLSAKTAK